MFFLKKKGQWKDESFDTDTLIMILDEFEDKWIITLAVIIFAIVQSAGCFKCLSDDPFKGSF